MASSLIPWHRQFQKADLDETSNQIGAAIVWRDNRTAGLWPGLELTGTNPKCAAIWGIT